jgi:hypothetical protein
MDIRFSELEFPVPGGVLKKAVQRKVGHNDRCEPPDPVDD